MRKTQFNSLPKDDSHNKNNDLVKLTRKEVLYFFKSDIVQIKYFGNSLASNFRTYSEFTDERLNEIFPNENFLSFFFYNYDRKISLLNRIEKLNEKKAKARALNVIDSYSLKIVDLNEKLDKVNHAAYLRFRNHKYMRRKFVQFILSEMLYEAQKQKSIGGKSGNSYATDLMRNYRKMQRDFNFEMLSKKAIVVNNKKISLTTFANTAQKKVCELYSKVKGMQEYAEEIGYSWAFVTMTASPEFHANPTKGKNTWNNMSAKKAHENLHGKWQALGKEFSNLGYSMKAGDMFGLRVVEPHQDGCPHWHAIVFYDPSLDEDSRVLLSDDENGLFAKHFAKSSQYGLKIVKGKKLVDSGSKEKVASAASYCFKYILKSIGADILDDFEAFSNTEDITDVSNSVEKIEAWKAALNVRAYQTFGFNGSSSAWNSTRKVAKQTGLLSSELVNDKRVFSFNIPPTDNLDILSHVEYTTSEENLAITNSQLDYIDSLSESEKMDLGIKDFELNTDDFTIRSQDELMSELPKRTRLFINHNGSLTDLELLSIRDQVLNITKSSVENNFCKFIKLSKENNVEIIYEKHTDFYGEIKKKAIGINAGTQILLFDTYTIVNIEDD